MDDPMSQHDYQYAHANPVNFTDPTGYFSVGDVFAAIGIAGILASIGGSVGYVGGQYLTGNGPDGEELLNMADQWVAGFANAVTFGATTYIRSSWYGETVTQNHSGLLWNMGQLAGLGSSLLIGGASPHAVKFSMSGTEWFATAHAVSGTAVSAWETGTHTREGRLEWTDTFTLLPLVPYAASSQGVKQFIGAAKDVTGRLRDWGGMQAKAYFEASYRSGWTSETGAIWTPNNKKGWSPIQNAFEHWKKHGAEFPQMQNSKQYVDATTDFLNNPPSTALTKVRPNGDVVVYDPISDTFGVRTSNGVPRTMYTPDPSKHGYPTNLDYFNAQ